jgi:TonB-linked SusC/RagA family outer membrane protein
MRKFHAFFLWLMVFLATTSMAQGQTISGKISDTKGAPVTGASITVKGKKTAGTTSDAQGSFKIAAAKGDVLLITSLNFTAQEVAVGSNASVNVKLESSEAALAEVVVTAMGIKRSEKAIGYAVSKVDPGALLQKSEPNILNALAGKVPGVDIRAGQGAPGAASRIQIRGVSSFNGGEPLIVVDGIPYSNNLVNTTSPFSGGGTYGSGLGNLDPNDIESMNILKGAAASSLYGSRAANGVVLITTKSGAPKKGAKSLNVTYRAGYSIEKIADIPTFQNNYGAGANFRTQSSNGSWGAKFGKGVIYDANGLVIGSSASGIDSIPATTWATMFASYPELFPNGRLAYKAVPDNVSSLFNTGNLVENSIGLNGGEGNTLFNATLSRTDQVGYITNSSYTKNNISVGGQTAIGKLTIGANIAYSRTKQIGGFVGQAQSFISQWGRTYTMARNWDITGWPSENRAGQQIGFNDGQYTNPVWGAKNNVITSIDERVVANVRGTYKFNKKLKLDVNAGVNSYALFRDQIINKSSLGSADNLLGTLTKVVNRTQEIQAKIALSYNNPKIFENFSLDVTVASDVNSRIGSATTNFGVDFVIPNLFNLTNTRRQSFSGDSRSNRRLVGVFADASIGYKGFAYLNLTGRTDLTSTLPYQNAKYFYPGISGSLVWTDALNLKSKWLDYGKVRVGYAKVGNDAAPQNGEPIFNLSALGFLGQPLATRGGATFDPNLTPEFTTELEIGTEARFFKQRLGFEFTWYDKVSTDLIYAINLPVTSGYTSFFTNLGEIQNTGIEAALDVKPIVNKNFEWNIRGVFTKNINMVNRLVQGLTRDQLGGFNWIEPGFPYGYLRGSYSARTPEGELLISPVSGMPFVDPNPGMVGNPNADFKLGITNSFSYKGFQLSVLWDMTKGGAFYSETIGSMLGRGVTKDTEDREKNRVITGVYGNATPVTGADGLNRFTPLLVGGKTVPNQTRVTTNDLFFTAGTGGSFATNGAFEYAVFDGTVYRLREVVLGYTLPMEFVRKLRLSNVTLSLSGRNLWFLAPNVPKYMNFDPDINSAVGSGTQGVETGGAPSSKRYGINLNVTF